jgi:tetratricopeptide (TPR) repeat protein
MLLLAAVLVTANSGCSWLGFLPGFGDKGASGRVDVKPEQVVDELSSARTHMQLAPREPYWPFRMGELYAASDSAAQAVSFLNAALTVDPSYAPAAVLLSRIYYDAKMHAQAVSLLDDFLAHNAAAPDAVRAALALHLEALGEIDRAQSVLSACASESRDAHVARTMIALRGSDATAALAAARQALDADQSAANYNNYGIALLYAGRPLEARDAFGKALDLNEQLPGALYNLAIVETFYFFDEATGREWFARYRQYASEDPDNLKARFEADVSKTQKVRD